MKWPYLEIPNIYTFAVPLNIGTTAGVRIKFGFIEQLKGKKIIGFITYNDSNLTLWTDLVPVVPAATTAAMLVTLFDDKSYAFISDIPHVFYNAIAAQSNIKIFTPRVINWETSYLTYNFQSAAAATYAMVFSALYFN
jgi:hypothetical protein